MLCSGSQDYEASLPQPDNDALGLGFRPIATTLIVVGVGKDLGDGFFCCHAVSLPHPMIGLSIGRWFLAIPRPANF